MASPIDSSYRYRLRRRSHSEREELESERHAGGLVGENEVVQTTSTRY